MERSIASYLGSECPIWEGEVPEWADQITLEHLLNHRSGLVEIFNEELVPEMQQIDAQGVPLYKQPLSTGQIISMIKKKPLLFKPGSDESYNNTGYLIAKEILAKITDMPYEQAIQELLLTPLQLADTHILPSNGHFDEYAKLHPELAHSLKKNSSGEWIKGGDDVNLSYTHGPGFLTSTTNDLLRWNLALHRDQRVLSHEAYRYMIDSKCGIDEDNVAEYGLLYGHQGSLEGFEAFLGYFPERELSIVIISNTSGDSGAMKLMEELFPD